MPTRSLLLALLALLLLPAAAAADEARPGVVIQRSAHGTPHIEGKTLFDAGYGNGYTMAEDHLCVLADVYVTVRGERARFFGPAGSYVTRGNGVTSNNLNSDFFFQRIIDENVIEKLLELKPPQGPLPDFDDIVRGYVGGYNAYLRAIGGPAGVKDPACKGQEWVRPITRIDAYRRFYQLALLASQGVAIDGVGAAAPPPGVDLPAARSEDRRAMGAADAVVAALKPGEVDERLGGLGSNAYGLGSEATRSGRGIVLGNPHFPWEGSERFFQTQLRVPGKLNVSGASLLGVPGVLIGFTENLAWSHTVSTARRFTIFEHRLVPGAPTSYIVDGQVRKMRASQVTVMVKGADGSLAPRSRTLYSIGDRPVLTSILGLPVFPWTPERVFVIGDANATNFRLLNHFFETDKAQSVKQLDAIEREYQGIPWVNTIAADSTGQAYYADIGSMPGLTSEKITRCSTVIGVALDLAQRVQVLDGSNPGCDWDTGPGAVAPGQLGPDQQPSLFRRDYVLNANDSYWLTQPRQPLEGFSRVIGDEQTTRGLRTRMGITLAEERLADTDGEPGGPKFDVENLSRIEFNNRGKAAELWREPLVAYCRANPTVPSSIGPVDATAACDVLAAWSGRDDLDAPGAVLFRRFATRALGAIPSPYTVAFDNADPVNTPRGLATENPQVQLALGDAIRDLAGAGIPVDAGLRGYQFEKRGSEEVPIHGGPGGTGVFNVITAPFNAKRGFPDVVHGSSYVQVVETGGGCPKAKTILTYSQSTDPTSPYFADQTKLYSEKKWIDQPFCRKDIEADPALKTTLLGSRDVPALSRVRVKRTARSRLVTFVLKRPARVSLSTERGGKIVRRVSRKRLRSGTNRLRIVVGSKTTTLRLSAKPFGERRLTLKRRTAGSRPR
ncbi:MAG: penicillin acylase family protein [Solirubrobacterales bacterium]|nr:penicillin acylase family protein [Solirubrobacterales bacterium]